MKVYNSMNEAVLNGSMQSEQFESELRYLSGVYNVELIVIDADSKLVQSAGAESDMILKALLDRVFSNAYGDAKKLKEEEHYSLELVKINPINITYIQMWGTLDNGNLFMARSIVDSIHDSVQITNRFLAYVGILAALASVIVILIITKKITTPILSLTDISKRMAELDFEVRYVGKEKNEIGILGQHMNLLSDKLESTISELKTANNELQKDIEDKEQIDIMRREFLSNVSHELKTPIALIMGYSEGLKENIVQDNVENKNFYCDVIIDEAKKMNEMVKKLLTLNQLEFGNEAVNMERFEINELINGIVNNSEILINQNDAKVLLDLGEPCFVWSDEFKIEEVFMNFFSNALNHLDGKREILISLKRYEDKIRVSVFNTGNTIPEESIPHLFEKFYKVDKARTREYGGSGIGLSIVKAIMDSIHQKYGVLNHSDGVEFWFELPCK